jgi:hypothetical protein
MTSKSYTAMLQSNLLPIADRCCGQKWKFVQDNAPIHVSNESMEWFKEKEVDLFPIPPNSPDLNLMENVWGMLARRVYHEQKSFHNVNELKNAIILAWDSIKIEELRPILASMPERLFQVAAKRGGMTTF